MKAIVYGASGFIGYHLTEKLLSEGHTVFAVCRNGIGNLVYISNKKNLIIISPDEIESKAEGADVWYHLAWDGACGEPRSDAQKQINNELLAVSAMERASIVGCKRIIYAGTIYENITETILENLSFDKNSFYIIAKKHTREMTYQLSKKLGIDFVWLSFCQPVGRYMKESQLIPYAVRCFVQNKPTEFGSCSQYFDVVAVEDLAAAFILLGEKEIKKNFYYYGSGEPRKLKDYLIEAARICNYNLEIGFGKRADDGMMFKKEWFDCSDFDGEFGKKQRIGFSDNILLIKRSYI